MTQPLDIPNVIDVTGQLRTLEVKYRTDLAASASVSTTICHLQDYLRVRPELAQLRLALPSPRDLLKGPTSPQGVRSQHNARGHRR